MHRHSNHTQNINIKVKKKYSTQWHNNQHLCHLAPLLEFVSTIYWLQKYCDRKQTYVLAVSVHMDICIFVHIWGRGYQHMPQVLKFLALYHITITFVNPTMLFCHIVLEVFRRDNISFRSAVFNGSRIWIHNRFRLFPRGRLSDIRHWFIPVLGWRFLWYWYIRWIWHRVNAVRRFFVHWTFLCVP